MKLFKMKKKKSSDINNTEQYNNTNDYKIFNINHEIGIFLFYFKILIHQWIYYNYFYMLGKNTNQSLSSKRSFSEIINDDIQHRPNLDSKGSLISQIIEKIKNGEEDVEAKKFFSKKKNLQWFR